MRTCLIKETSTYFVSENGRVFSIDHKDRRGRLHKGQEILPSLDKDGYRKVHLNLGERGKSITRRVGRLVAGAFIENPENKPFVNHKDGNKQNDCVENLEWSTAKENTRHAWNTGLCKPYDRTQDYNRQDIIDSNKRRAGSRRKQVCGI